MFESLFPYEEPLFVNTTNVTPSEYHKKLTHKYINMSTEHHCCRYWYVSHKLMTKKIKFCEASEKSAATSAKFATLELPFSL